MTKQADIREYLNGQQRFFRSVSLERDIKDPTAARSYVVTPWLRTLLDRFLSGAEARSTRRAWRLTGDFGVGKSALALALAHYLDPRTRTFASHVPAPGLSHVRLMPVIVVGSRTGIVDALSSSVKLAIDDRLALSERKKQELLESVRTDPAKGFEMLAALVGRSNDYDGVFLIIDELGKLLEHAAATSGDIMALQNLAEASARSGENAFLMLTILHQGITSYAEAGSPTVRSEWAKVAERFEELNFDHPLTHTAALVAAALSANTKTLPASVRKSFNQSARAMTDIGWLEEEVSGEAGCYPLHPSFLAVAPRFFSLFGQNERSLFGFLASEEPFSVRAFCGQPAHPSTLYRLDNFFDYVAYAFGGRVIGRNAGADWGRIQSVVRRASDRTETEARILKIVGLLTLTDADHLVANVDAIAACLAPGPDVSEVREAVESLKASGLLFERAGMAGLRLWAARRIDMNALWREAEGAVPRIESFGETLAGLARPKVILARRHAIRSGTLRQFSVQYLPYSRVANHKPKVEGDGSVLVVLPDNEVDFKCAVDWAVLSTKADSRILVAVLPTMSALTTHALELRRARWLDQNAAGLRDDPFASAELSRQIAFAERGIDDALAKHLGFVERGDGNAVFVWKAETIDNPGALHVLISDVCDLVYDNAPRVQNELINRRNLSSAAAGARQRLLEAAFSAAEKPALGMSSASSPPERALYLSVYERGRLHVERGGNWSLALPPEGDKSDPLALNPVLSFLEQRLRKSEERVSAQALLEEIGEPPYGVRDGLSILLLGHILALHRDHIAVYERGTFIARFDGAVFMRLTKAPDLFAFQWSQVEGIRAAVFSRLAEVLSEGTSEGLISVVRPLVKFGADLPFHTLKTQQLSPRATKVRQALQRAGSPVDLLFVDLPVACDCSAFVEGNPSEAQDAKTFVARLQEAMDELRGAYPVFLSRLRSDLYGALNDERAALGQRAEALQFRLTDASLRAFAQRMADRNNTEDGWVEALAGAVAGKTPNRWLDLDEARWRATLEVLAGQFARVEAINFKSIGQPGASVRLALMKAGGEERMTIVKLPETGSTEAIYAQSLANNIREQKSDTAAILAMLSTILLEEDEIAEAPADKEADRS